MVFIFDSDIKQGDATTIININKMMVRKSVRGVEWSPGARQGAKI